MARKPKLVGGSGAFKKPKLKGGSGAFKKRRKPKLIGGSGDFRNVPVIPRDPTKPPKRRKPRRPGVPVIGPAPAKPPKRKRPPRDKAPVPLPQSPIKGRPGPKNPGPPKELPARPPKRRKPRNTFKGQGRGRIGRPTIGPAPARRRARRKTR